MWIGKVKSHLRSMSLMSQPCPTWVGNNHKKLIIDITFLTFLLFRNESPLFSIIKKLLIKKKQLIQNDLLINANTWLNSSREPMVQCLKNGI